MPRELSVYDLEEAILFKRSQRPIRSVSPGRWNELTEQIEQLEAQLEELRQEDVSPTD